MNIKYITKKDFSILNNKSIIEYSYQESKFGKIIVATFDDSLIYLGFSIDKNTDIELLSKKFIFFKESSNSLHIKISSSLFKINCGIDQIILVGSSFEHKVWKGLLTISYGSVASYKDISISINKPKASRAVGNAVGSNPISIIIPCHRVIRSDNKIGGYLWGKELKQKILIHENSKNIEYKF